MKTEKFPPTNKIDIKGQLKECPHDIQRYVKMLETNLNKAEYNCRKVVHKALEEAAEKAMVVETDVNKEVWAKDKQLIDLDGHRYRVDKESILSLKEKY